MKVAFLIDRDSVFNTSNFIKLINEIGEKEDLKIDFIMNLKKCSLYDFIFSFSKKYEKEVKRKWYKVYPLYDDLEIKEFVDNDLFYYNEYYDFGEYNELFVYEKSVITKIIHEFKENNKEYINTLEMIEKVSENKNDFAVIKGNKKVLISAPHNVSQYFNGRYKPRDLGSGNLALGVARKSDCYCIIKTKNIGNVFKNDNANKQVKCKYKDEIKKLVNDNKIKLLIDIHTLTKNRKEQINLGTDYGRNIFNNNECKDNLVKIINDYGFTVSVDYPFSGGGNTVASYSNKELGIYSLQIEINSKYINYNSKFSRYKELVEMINEMIDYLYKK